PLMIWYGLIPVADTDPSGLARLAGTCELPATRQYIARRLAEDNQTSPGPLTTLLGVARSKPEAFQLDVLTGFAQAWRGLRKVPAPAAWEDWKTTLDKAADPLLRDRARDLGALFGDGRALEDVKRLALDRDGELAARKAALRTLIESRPPELRSICEGLL